MKAFTDIVQSQVLAGILPIESADMWYSRYDNSTYNPTISYKGEQWFLCQFRNSLHSDIPCWSLAALMELMPERIKIGEELSFCLTSKKSIAGFSFGYNLKGSTFVKDNLIDAAFEMIVWLKENNKI